MEFIHSHFTLYRPAKKSRRPRETKASVKYNMSNPAPKRLRYEATTTQVKRSVTSQIKYNLTREQIHPTTEQTFGDGRWTDPDQCPTVGSAFAGAKVRDETLSLSAPPSVELEPEERVLKQLPRGPR
ncbi:hypothetical protein THAOC_30525, partial [Thalassiosira oceanica]